MRGGVGRLVDERALGFVADKENGLLRVSGHLTGLLPHPHFTNDYHL